MYTYIYIYIYIIYTLSVLLTLLRKKENALITHSAMETWECVLSEISSFYLYALFRKFRTPLDSEPAAPLPFYIH